MLLVIIIVVLLVAFYFYGIRNHDYWKKKGVPYEEPMFLFGSNLKHIMDGVSVSERFAHLYRSYPHEKYVGFYEGSDPGLLLRDPEMIKRVLQGDFKSFHYRGFNPDRENVEPLMKNLFFADGDIWKLLRQKMTPMFSSGKLKAMFPLITERAERLTVIAEELASTRDEVDVRDLVARYTTDVIGAVGFGIESEALDAENSEVRKLSKRIFAVTKRDFVVSLVKRMQFPVLCSRLNFVPPEIERTTTSLATQCMAQRKYKPSGRNDFIDLLLELRQKEVIVGDSLSETNADGSPAQVELQVDDSLIAAQVFVLFAAGYETSSHVSSFLMHTLAYHPEKQARCQREIDEILKANDGKLSYDGLKEMKYVEMCLKEAMRLLPSPGFLARRSVSKYTFPETNVTIDENVLIIIPIDALHNDEQYFERPSEFWPERFADSGSKFEKDLYMPFGAGPRACIGERLGLLQSMAGVASILSKFTLSPSKSTVEKPIIDKNSILTQNILGGLPLSLKQRNKID